MKKVININFQGRVIPIEESAYDVLKQYVESLRRYFANEEGRDEIINDIEGRIAELFGETIKKGSTCITDVDVDTIIASMGRPEDFDGEEANVKQQLGGEQYQQTYTNSTTSDAPPRGRLYRDENDKILGGVCSGVAAYLRIDPTMVRLLFALFTFVGGGGFLLYIIMWIILPKKRIDNTFTNSKRLYRNPEEKVVAGVASGIARYFNIAVWIPRVIFALPIISAIIASIFRHAFWWDNDIFPNILFGSFTGTLSIIYIVLWAVIPEAKSASEKLEMRGEKVDLNSIKNTIQEDLEGFRGRAEKFGKQVEEKAKVWSEDFSRNASEVGKNFGNETGGAVRRNGNRFLSVIGIMFKAFFLFIAGMIAFALLMALLGVFVGGVAIFPLKNFFLNGFWPNALAWITIVCFLLVPLIGLVTWIIKRIMGIKSKNNYLGYTFGGLWTIGIISLVFLAATISRDFRTKSGVEENASIVQPAKDKMYVTVAKNRVAYYGSDWFGINWDDEDAPFYGLSEDSILMRTIRINITKSADSSFHIHLIKFSHGNDPAIAKNFASHINFPVQQNDSIITLPDGFAVTKTDKFRNQQVLIIIEVPEGKKIEMDESLKKYHWFNVNVNRRRGLNVDWNSNWENTYGWDDNIEYTMTAKGLKSTKKRSQQNSDEEVSEEEKKEELNKIEQEQKELDEKKKRLLKDIDSTKYKYEPVKPKKTPEPQAKNTIKVQATASPTNFMMMRFCI